MQTWGSWIQLLGTFVTGLGLVIAWQRASGKLNPLIELPAQLRQWLAGTREPVVVPVDGALMGVATARGRLSVTRNFDATTEHHTGMPTTLTRSKRRRQSVDDARHSRRAKPGCTLYRRTGVRIGVVAGQVIRHPVPCAQRGRGTNGVQTRRQGRFCGNCGTAARIWAPAEIWLKHSAAQRPQGVPDNSENA